MLTGCANETDWAERYRDWFGLVIGEPLTLVKLAPDGHEAARYSGTIQELEPRERWIMVEASWTHRRVDVEGLTFAPGDILHEWFSPHHGFNAFAVHSDNGCFRGWYANVTHPPTLDCSTAPRTLVWRDLYIDIVALADGAIAVSDEDELAGSGLMQSQPHLYEHILRARDEILDRLDHGQAPFFKNVTPPHGKFPPRTVATNAP